MNFSKFLKNTYFVEPLRMATSKENNVFEVNKLLSSIMDKINVKDLKIPALPRMNAHLYLSKSGTPCIYKAFT